MRGTMLVSQQSAQGFVRAYDRMLVAINECYELRPAMDIEQAASAAEAALKVINDDDGLRKIRRIKLLAWRRIGEILLSDGDYSSAEYTSDYSRIAHDAARRLGMTDLSRAKAGEAVAIARVPKEDFERALGIATGRRQMLDMTCPRKRAAAKEAELRHSKFMSRMATDQGFREGIKAKNQKRADALQELAALEEVRDALAEEYDQARADVGYTLTASANDLKRVVVLLRPEEYELLRLAQMEHQDKNISRWEIMRQGLRMWLAAHGYGLKPTS